MPPTIETFVCPSDLYERGDAAMPTDSDIHHELSYELRIRNVPFRVEFSVPVISARKKQMRVDVAIMANDLRGERRMIAAIECKGGAAARAISRDKNCRAGDQQFSCYKAMQIPFVYCVPDEYADSPFEAGDQSWRRIAEGVMAHHRSYWPTAPLRRHYRSFFGCVDIVRAAEFAEMVVEVNAELNRAPRWGDVGRHCDSRGVRSEEVAAA